jgi:hypothetical protein
MENAQEGVKNAQKLVTAWTDQITKLLSSTGEKGILFCPFSFVFLLRQTPNSNTDFPQKKNLTTKSQHRVLVQKGGFRCWCFFFYSNQ